MSQPDATVFHDVPGSRRERQWLLPTNRKLRNLQGISVRSLTLNPPTRRSRNRTNDDDNVPNNLRTPTKLLAQNEEAVVHHSRSHSDLHGAKEEEESSEAVDVRSSSPTPISKKTPRPTRGQMRRRSTLHFSGASPGMRQKRLETVAAGRIADAWFSLHCEGFEDPVYVSETVENAMNPDFGFFDLTPCGPAVSRLDNATFKLWTKTLGQDQYTLLLTWNVHFEALQYVGKSLENFHHPLPSNCVLFHFPDGIYTSLTDAPAAPSALTQASAANPVKANAEWSASFDSLMRLANLDDCVQDAISTRSRLEAEISSILEKTKESRRVLDAEVETRDRLAAVDRKINEQRIAINAAKRSRDQLAMTNKARRDFIEHGRKQMAASQAHLEDAEPNLQSGRETMQNLSTKARGQIRRLAENLISIYPVEPVAGRSLAFSIRGLYLPNSNYENIDKASLAAALGYVAQVVHQTSNYLLQNLPYPIKPMQSTSLIVDPISKDMKQRVFPLYPIGSVQYQFEYGVFLLNKDIEFLLSNVKVRMVDIRHTLPNLKYLFYILTTGTGDIPARKVGGIRALGIANSKAGSVTSGSPSMSRRGSNESVRSFNDAANLAAKVADRLNEVHEDHEKGIDDAKRNGNGNGLPPRESRLLQKAMSALPVHPSGLRDEI